MEYYFKSDFSIVETFTDAEGNPINLNDFDFEIIYQTTGVNNYRVSKKGTTFTHCSIDEADTSKLNVIFQDHRLGCGKLHREISIKVCNPLFKDYQLVVTHPFTEITLVQNGGDQTTGCARAGIPVVIPLTPSVIDDIADADSFLGISALGVFFKTTWLNIKAKLKAYFDTIYASITHNHNLNDLTEKSYNSLTDTPSLDFEPANENIQSHIGDEDIHVTSTEKSTWNDKQDALTFSTNIEADKASTTKVSAIKTLYDWAVGKFIDLSKIVTTWTATTLNTNIPSEKLVKDSLDLKSNLAGGNTFSGNQNFDSNTLFVDSVNHRVGVGISTPKYKMHLYDISANSWPIIAYYEAPNSIGGHDVVFKNAGDAGSFFIRSYNSQVPNDSLIGGTLMIQDTSSFGFLTLAAKPIYFSTNNRYNAPDFAILPDGSMNMLSTKNQYLAASPTSDTVNDIRVRNDNGVLKTERCTVANATKGAGTWVDASVKVGNDTASASAANAGTIRYRADANNSYVEMCMQTGASTYAWIIIKQNTW